MKKKLQSKSLYKKGFNQEKYAEHQVRRHVSKRKKRRHITYYRSIVNQIERLGYTPKGIYRWRPRLSCYGPFTMACMGTRNNWERDVFGYYLETEEVISVDISPFSGADVITDFNKFPADWNDTLSIIYSNSLDHTVDPTFTFDNWLKLLKPEGLMILGISGEDNEGDVAKADCSAFTSEASEVFLNERKDVKLMRKSWVISGPNSKCGDPHYFIKKL